MKYCSWFAVLILLHAFHISKAQSLVPSVIASSGGFYSNASGMLSFTTGELSSIETYSSPNLILTQGFQQSWDFGTAVDENDASGFSFEVIPNPSDGHFSLSTRSDVNEMMNVKILDLLGKEISNVSFYHEGVIHDQAVDLSGVASGLYLIVLSTKSTGHDQASITKKIQIVK
ncbi:MAG TPA: T9SS type A sorting domain-containing protein [Saprospiraceae bacterium]|nr:T9SS type A sorting domain-containing protein [Saprospiraceae bacterium]